MQELEKILEEIDNHAIEFEYFGMCDDYVSVGWVKEIIRSHMNDNQGADWIACSERLPETNGVYNVTRFTEGYYVSDSAYFDGQDTWHNDNRVNHSREYLKDVVYWCPLPEPYKPFEETRQAKDLREREEFFYDT